MLLRFRRAHRDALRARRLHAARRRGQRAATTCSRSPAALATQPVIVVVPRLVGDAAARRRRAAARRARLGRHAVVLPAGAPAPARHRDVLHDVLTRSLRADRSDVGRRDRCAPPTLFEHFPVAVLRRPLAHGLLDHHRPGVHRLVRARHSCSRRASTITSRRRSGPTATTSCTSSSRPARRRSTATTASRSSPTARSSIRRCATRSCAAEASVNLEAYIFQPGDAADMLIDAMVERAQAGVEVRVVLDAIGSCGDGRRRGAAAARRRLPGQLLPADHAGTGCTG